MNEQIMSEERSCCVIDSWFSNARRMGLAAAVCFILAVISVLLHTLLSAFYNQQSFVAGITMILAFVFIAGFAVAFAIFLILQLEKRVRRK